VLGTPAGDVDLQALARVLSAGGSPVFEEWKNDAPLPELPRVTEGDLTTDERIQFQSLLRRIKTHHSAQQAQINAMFARARSTRLVSAEEERNVLARLEARMHGLTLRVHERFAAITAPQPDRKRAATAAAAAAAELSDGEDHRMAVSSGAGAGAGSGSGSAASAAEERKSPKKEKKAAKGVESNEETKKPTGPRRRRGLSLSAHLCALT
jgi:hypothetical protein